ncbi:MAG: DUF6898 family protein [Candidatus Eiseniibacteriota bacterium]
MTRQDEEVLLEFHQIGSVVKVSAVDPVTLTEVSISGPASAGEQALKQAAIRKLRYVLARAKGQRAH